MTSVPLHIVRDDGRVEHLGEWRAPTLVLERAGFPFLQVGEHVIDADLPWLFWDMCPSGFMGRVYARALQGLRLPADPRTWSANQALEILANHGADLPGNVIVGEASLAHYQAERTDLTEALDRGDALHEAFEHVLGEASPESSSSLGGERPKWVTDTHLVKYSPPVETEAGRRWADLLRTEALCALTLSAHGVRTSDIVLDEVVVRRDRRLWLPVRRFDRSAQGRIGASTVYWLSMARFGDVQLPAPEVFRRLANDGLVAPSDAETVSRVHAFSAAIGNTDAHLGNYGLVFDERGRATLAPVYDVLPMALAPQHDELPDQRLQPRQQPIDVRIAPWVDDLVARVTNDPVISAPFKALWLRFMGR